MYTFNFLYPMLLSCVALFENKSIGEALIVLVYKSSEEC